MKIHKRTLRLSIAVVAVAAAALAVAAVVMAGHAVESPTGNTECTRPSDNELSCTGALANQFCGEEGARVSALFTGPDWEIVAVNDEYVLIDGSEDLLDIWCTERPVFLPAVQPMVDPALSAVPAADGRLPCGLYNLNATSPPGHGYKVAYLAGWPACPQDGHQLDMLCMNGEGAWVTPEFTDLQVTADGMEMNWVSHQHGVCGFFPK